jgi:hypothetical protein
MATSDVTAQINVAVLGLTSRNFIASDTVGGAAAVRQADAVNGNVLILGGQGTATNLDNATIGASGNSQTLTIQAGQQPLSLTLVGDHTDARFIGLSVQDFSVEPMDTITRFGPALQLHIVPTTDVSGATTDITLPGYSTVDLNSGRVSLNFETSGGQPVLHLQTSG